MSFEHDIPFRKELEQSSNVYEVVRNVMDSARELSTRCDNKILHSQAITHVINGTKPDDWISIDFDDEYEAYQIREMFCYIDDKDICDAVYDSFYKSKKSKNLVYVYNDIVDINRQARVRVLTRMLWYKLVK